MRVGQHNEYDLVGAFAVASMLILLAVLTLVIKAAIEILNARQQRPGPP